MDGLEPPVRLHMEAENKPRVAYMREIHTLIDFDYPQVSA